MQKQCTKCKEFKPATPEYFHREKIRGDGLKPWCKVCVKVCHQGIHSKLIEAAYRWKDSNPEKYKQAKSNYKKSNPNYRISVEKYREKNREKSRAYASKYRKEHKREVVFWAERRRARKAENGGSYTLEEWEALCAFYDYRCLCCKEQKNLTVDHVIPISKGGRNDISNLQPLCQECNSRKNKKTIDYRP